MWETETDWGMGMGVGGREIDIKKINDTGENTHQTLKKRKSIIKKTHF